MYELADAAGGDTAEWIFGMSMKLQPHDLLRLDEARLKQIVVPEDAGCAEAVERCLRRTPFVVVRRVPMRDGMVAVGVRGESRSERFAAWVVMDGIREVRTPESLRSSGVVRDLPALAALREMERRWESSGWVWGPVGSVGFEIASGVQVVTGTSDLDMIVRADERMPFELLRKIGDGCCDLPCRADVQVETPWGGFALLEALQRPVRLLLRTCSGPMLVEDPWCEPQAVAITA